MRKRNISKKTRCFIRQRTHNRQLCFENLEDRDLLATLTVGTNFENSTSATVNNGVLTIREAIDYVNQTAIPLPLDAQRINNFGGTQPLGVNDKIVFDASLNGQTINLTSAAGGEIVINKEVSIDASVLSNGVTIHAAPNSRVFRVGYYAGNVNLERLTITGGNVTGSGGAIETEANLSLLDCTIIGNQASDVGGGIRVSGAGLHDPSKSSPASLPGMKLGMAAGSFSQGETCRSNLP